MRKIAKPTKKAALWLRVADHYIAQIAAAERAQSERAEIARRLKAALSPAAAEPTAGQDERLRDAVCELAA